MSERWKLKPFDMVDRLANDARRDGVITMHLASGRMYHHKHGYNVATDAPSVALAIESTAKTLRHKRGSSADIYVQVNYKKALAFLTSCGTDHVAAWRDGDTIVIAAVKHVPSMKQARKAAEDAGVTDVYSCRFRETRPMDGRRTQAQFKLARRGGQSSIPQRATPDRLKYDPATVQTVALNKEVTIGTIKRM